MFSLSMTRQLVEDRQAARRRDAERWRLSHSAPAAVHDLGRPRARRAALRPALPSTRPVGGCDELVVPRLRSC